MGARKKLNEAYFMGGIAMAVVVGLAFDSWIAGTVMFALCVAMNVYDGGIRVNPTDSRRDDR